MLSTGGGGYVPDFLRVSVELPAPAGSTILLDYTHFSIRLRAARRLAVVAAVNINGSELVPLAREGIWHFDTRVPRNVQAGPEVYQNNDLDRGHLVRRLDPVWGDETTARTANQDTFTYSNAAPQASDFNQGMELWRGLEDHVLNHADHSTTPGSAFSPARSWQTTICRTGECRYPGNSGRSPSGPWRDSWPPRDSCSISRPCWERRSWPAGHHGNGCWRTSPRPLGPSGPSRCPCGRSQRCPEWPLTRLEDADRFIARSGWATPGQQLRCCSRTRRKYGSEQGGARGASTPAARQGG